MFARRSARITTISLSMFFVFHAPLARPETPKNRVQQNIQILSFGEDSTQYSLLDQEYYDLVKESFGKLSKEFNKSLFKTKNLRHPPKMRDLISNTEKLPSYITNNRHGSVQTGDLSVHWTFFDRDSDTLLVIGGGLANSRELLAPFAALFPTYDIVTFDYRGHGIDHKAGCMRSRLSKWLIGFDPTVSKLGQEEEEEILAITNHFKSRKKYQKVLGLGLCYSATLLAKTEALHPKTFDKLVLDGSWDSMAKLAETFIRDPYLFLNPQKGGRVLRFVNRCSPMRYLTKMILKWVFLLDFKQELDALKYFARLTSVPILFIHSNNDLLISNKQFGRVWDSIPHGQKMAVIVPGRHLQCFLKHKELYSFIGHLFFEHPYEYACRMLQHELSDQNFSYPG